MLRRTCLAPPSSVAGDLAFDGRWRYGADRTVKQRAGVRPGARVIRRRRPTTCRGVHHGQDHAVRVDGFERVEIGRVRAMLVEEGFFGRREILQVAFHGGEICLALRRLKLRDRHRGKNADDDHDDQ